MSYRDPDHTYRCAGECRQLLDDDEYRPLTVNGALVCPECCEMCNFCMEWLDDDQAKLFGPLVRARNPEGGCLAGHTLCVGQHVLGLMAEIPGFDVDDYTKAEIAEFYAVAQLRGQPFSWEAQRRLYDVRREAAHA